MNKQVLELIMDTVVIIASIAFMASACWYASQDDYSHATFNLVLGFGLMDSMLLRRGK
jgi:hypothetical protein